MPVADNVDNKERTMSVVREVTLNDRKIKFEFQKYAKQANGSVMVTSGQTQVLVTVCAEREPNPNFDFFPLGVDYIEKAYAAGRVPGGYQKREGKPSDLAALSARVIDRPLRPSFPKDYKNETVVTATVVSYEHGHSPAPLALIGASTALMISEIPFNGPVAAMRVGIKNGEYIIDPPEGEDYDLDLNIACNPEAVLMVEAGANFLSEEQMLDAIHFAHSAMKPFFDMQLEIQAAIGKEKWSVAESDFDEALYAQVKIPAEEKLRSALSVADKKQRGNAVKEVTAAVLEEFGSDEARRNEQIKSIVSNLKSELMRQNILENSVRIDGRGPKDIRPISCEIGCLARPHGSALFTRGETQALASTTLSAAEDVQRVETLWETDLRDRFLLHYNFPPFCVGEARMQRPPGRREIGHGALAKRALIPVLPKISEFGYTIRLVSETLESNGSSSMAAVCSGTMAMLHAGVPIKAPVAGIAMGLVKSNENYSILSDILGDEDHVGDMDFKVCGTRDGITALQMDIKIGGLTKEILREALLQAKEGRNHILDKIEETIAAPSDLSGSAPRMFKVKINADKIRDVIGPGGKNIKRIVSDAGVKVDIDDSGIVSIVAPDATSAQAAKAMIRSFITSPQIGDIFLGKAAKVTEFGVFVELKPGSEGLCHISQWDDHRVDVIGELVKVDDEVLVKVVDIDKQGRIKLSRKDAFNQRPTYS